MPEPKRLLDLKSTAETLSMSTRSVRRLVARGLLTPHRALGKLLFRASDLDKFVEREG